MARMATVKKVLQIVLVALLVLAGVRTQQTLIVDAAGAGDFTDIQSAVDAADPGDLIRIRHGEYQGATITKGLRMVGDPIVQLGPRVRIASPIEVIGIPAHQIFVAALIDSLSADGFEMKLRDCQGKVHLDRMFIVPVISNCAYVTIYHSGGFGDSFFRPGNPGLTVVDSYVAMSDSNWFSDQVQPAIKALRSRLVMVRSTGQVLNATNSRFVSPAIILEDTILTRSTDSHFGVTCQIGGPCPPLVQKIGASVDATTNNRTLLVDEASSELVLRAPPQTPVAVLVSLPGMPVELNQGFTLGTLYLDLSSSHFLFFGQTGFDFLRLPIPLPTGERLGIPLTFQAGILVGKTLRLSHPHTSVF